MPLFRRILQNDLGHDFGTSAQEFPLPRARFSFSGSNGSLDDVERKVTIVFRDIFKKCGLIWLEMTFWDSHNQKTATNALKVLGANGLVASAGHWDYEYSVEDNEDPSDIVYSHRYSGQISPQSNGLPFLIKSIVHREHGMWNGISCRALFYCHEQHLFFYPYDDRGADLVAVDKNNLKKIGDSLSAVATVAYF